MLVNLVNELDQDQFFVHVISLSSNNPIANQIHSVAAEFTALPRKWRYDLRPAQDLRRIITKNQISAIVTFDIFCFFYIWIALWKVHPKPKVFISIHNIKFKNLKNLLQNLIYARLLSGTEVFVSVCDAQADYWSSTYRISGKSFTTIYNGVDTGFFSPSKDPNQKRLIRSNLNLPESAFVILQVASLTREKRHVDSLIALKHLSDLDASNPFFLAFVGNGPEEIKKQLRQMVRDLGLIERVTFYGVQTDVKRFYQAADIFTLTSGTETFSVAALEAMSMGLPCILTDVGGAREMIVDGMNGYLVQPKKPQSIAAGWLSVYKNNDTFDHGKIRNWVIEHFSLSDCVNKYENLLK